MHDHASYLNIPVYIRPYSHANFSLQHTQKSIDKSLIRRIYSTDQYLNEFVPSYSTLKSSESTHSLPARIDRYSTFSEFIAREKYRWKIFPSFKEDQNFNFNQTDWKSLHSFIDLFRWDSKDNSRAQSDQNIEVTTDNIHLCQHPHAYLQHVQKSESIIRVNIHDHAQLNHSDLYKQGQPLSDHTSTFIDITFSHDGNDIGTSSCLHSSEQILTEFSTQALTATTSINFYKQQVCYNIFSKLV